MRANWSVAIAAASIMAITALATGMATGPAGAQQPQFFDLSHTIPLFGPKDGDHTKADLSKPVKGSVPTASFGFQAVRIVKPNFPTKIGHFQWAWFYFDEHYGTHVDSTDHYVNAPGTLDVAKADGRSVEQYGIADIIGPIVYIDVADRVAVELAKNKGKPSPDAKVTNFGNGTQATVTPADIDAVAGQLANGSWLVIHTGWDKFYVGTPPENPFMHPYINGLNYPGLHKAAVERLIAIEKRKGIKINGIVLDNLSIDSGASGLGPTFDPNGEGWFAHAKGLQRGWKFIENAAGLGQLAGKAPGACTLIVGAIKLTGASGAPSRVLAMCR